MKKPAAYKDKRFTANDVVAARRLIYIKVAKIHKGYGFSLSRSADLLGLPTATLYRWLSRFDEQGAKGLYPRQYRSGRKPGSKTAAQKPPPVPRCPDPAEA